MEKKNNTKFIVALLFIVLIVGIRAIAPLSSDFKFLANFSALGAVAIFSGTYLKNKFSGYLLPLAILFLSDLALLFTMGADYAFYSGWYYTYLAFALMVFSGRVLVKKTNIVNVLSAGVIAVLIHWIVTDFGVWLGSGIYPQTLAGFWACLAAAIPYELNFLYGTLLYSAIMYGTYELLNSKLPALKTVNA